ncbi:uncharacterized protein LOC144552671 isoform X2 [Carex rostrata]
MECNKEGAIRALEIAEKRLVIRDYAGAKEMALKAEKLFPQLDNISQLLTVSEVHCSSQLMVNGLYDWYKIIQVEPTSDEILIKKQYRKLALLLHPDKNKFPGAEAAFKLVAEANNTLSDRAKRIMYDIKRKHVAGLLGSEQITPTNAAHYSYSNSNRGFAFWTACPGCKTRYQYYSSILGSKVYCVNCPRPFVANALQHLNPGPMSGDGGTTKDSNHNSEPITSNLVQRRGKRVSADTSKPTADKNPCPNQNPPSSQPGFNSDVNPSRVDGNQTNDRSHTAGTSTPLRKSSHNKPDVKNNGTEADVSNPAKKARVEVKGGLDGNGTNTNVSSCVEREVREQDREKGKKANAINTDTNASTCVERELREQDRERKEAKTINTVTNASTCVDKEVREQDREKGKEQVEPSGTSLLDDSKARFVYPDSFCNFDKLKDVSKFTANQIWALYDSLDRMPRLYARICDVYNEPSFKIKYTWLVHDPVNKAEAMRSGAKFTGGCGNYTLGETEMTEYRYMFSHMVLSEKEKKKGELYVILPRKGEVWALFKDCSFKWGQKLDKDRKFEYEVVELLTDFSPASGVTIVPLVKVQGFVGVFVRVKDWVPIHVPHGEIHRFSHSVPAYRLNSSEIERKNLLEGSLELHTFALPTNLETYFPLVPIESIKPQTQSFSSKERNDREGSTNCGASNPSNGDASRVKNRDGDTLARRCESPQPNADSQKLEKNCKGSNPSNGDTSGPTLIRRCESPQPNADSQKLEKKCKGSNPSNGDTSGSRGCESLQPNADPQKLEKNCEGSNPSNGDTSGPFLTRRRESPQPNINSQELEKNCEGSNPSKGDTSGPTLTLRCESPQPKADSQNLYEYPDSKFYNFDTCRTCDNFQPGQIWALYSDVDTYPKYYGWIQKVELDPFKVHISWLEACPKSKVEKLWFNANLPISCGKFKVTTENTIYDSPDYLSHMVSVNYHKRGNYFKILPEVGEIWAVYKNWSAGWTLHDLKTCDFDIVQIREQREKSTVVFLMRQVPEYYSVFMRGSNTCEIPAIVFSHKIPAFRLTEERGGKFRGFWELDPASVPYKFFNLDM